MNVKRLDALIGSREHMSWKPNTTAMMKTIFAIFVFSLVSCSFAAMDKGAVMTWEYPEGRMNPNSFPGQIKYQITKVEFMPETTKVHITLYSSSLGNSFRYTPETCLTADGKTYRLIGSEGFSGANLSHTFPETGTADIVLNFESLPMSTENFDLTEGEYDTGYNISDVRQRDKGLVSSSWCDVKSGDWIISFFPDLAVYDTKEWQYAEKDFDKGRFVLTDGEKKLKVTVGKEKDGVRKLKIGDGKGRDIRRISTLHNSEYPAGGPTAFTDNGFREGDSVTITGWYKDMPPHLWEKGHEIVAFYEDLISRRKHVFSAPLDSLGHFSVTFPVPNTTAMYIDWERSKFTLPLEPGCSYYLLNDFSSGQTMWMGKKSRLINEICAFQQTSFPEHPVNMTSDQQREYLKYVKGHLKEDYERIDRIAEEKPGLSPLWAEWEKEVCRMNCATFAEMVPHFNGTGTFPDGLKEWINEEILPTLPQIPTAYPNLQFLNNFVYDNKKDSPYCFLVPLTSNRERSYMTPISPYQYDDIRTELDSIRSDIDKFIESSAEEQTLPGGLMSRATTLLQRILNFEMNGESQYQAADLGLQLSVLDSMKTPPVIRDLCMASYFCNAINQSNAPLSAYLETAVDTTINHPTFRNIVHRHNDIYKLPVVSDVEPGSCIPVPQEDLKGMTSGKEILEKVTEPFKGRLILIDVWGTWCGPCKAALRDFPKEKEELAPYDVVFMFFASSSPEETWKDVIAEYGITGDNVVHYNLPEAQEKAVESFLNVTGFPSYILVNIDGTPLFDIGADPRGRSLVPLVQRLKH